MSRSGLAALIFDLDGTLVDSLPGIEASLSHALGYRPNNLRSVIGPPVKTMLRRLNPQAEEAEIDEAVAKFRRHYDEEGCLRSHLFPAVAETLRVLQDDGLTLFVLTNKPIQPTLRILAMTGIQDRFRAVVSPDSSDPGFAVKREGALRLQQEFSLGAATTLLVGDGVDDAEAAEACGFGFVAADYGYGKAVARSELEPRAVLKDFSEMVEVCYRNPLPPL